MMGKKDATILIAVLNKVARKVKFDEEQKVAVETDFGFQFTKLGKIKYCPKALISEICRKS